jgi:hypothetical protein
MNLEGQSGTQAHIKMTKAHLGWDDDGVEMSEREGKERGAGGGFSTYLLSHCPGSHNSVTASEKNSENLFTGKMPCSRREREWW